MQTESLCDTVSPPSGHSGNLNLIFAALKKAKACRVHAARARSVILSPLRDMEEAHGENSLHLHARDFMGV